MKQNPHGRLFSLYPLAQLALAFTAGVFISNVIVIKLAAPISFCAVCSLLAFVAFAKRKLWLSGLALLSAMFFAGASLAVIEKSTSPADSVKRLLLAGLVEEEEQLTLTGVLNGPPEFARDRVYLVLRVENVVTPSCDLEATGTVSLLATFKTATSEQQYRQLDLHY